MTKATGQAAAMGVAAAPRPPAVFHDEKGRQIRLGLMQQWIADVLSVRPRTLSEVAAEIREDEGRARTRLRQLAAKGVALLGEDGVWRLAEGPVVPREPPPRATRPARRG